MRQRGVSTALSQFVGKGRQAFSDKRQHGVQDSMSSSQAVVYSHPCKREWSIPPLLLSHENQGFRGFPDIVVPSAMRRVISNAHAAGNDGFSFYSCVCGRRNSARLSWGGKAFDKLRASEYSEALFIWETDT